MWLLAAFVTTFCFGINNSILKWSTIKGLSKTNLQFFFYLIAFLVTITYGFVSQTLELHPLSTILGALIGILNANGNIQMSKAFEKGPASLTSPLVSINAIVPILGAGIIFHEQITVMQWVGIVCMFVAVFAIQYTPHSKHEQEHSYLPWLYHVILAILSFGVLGVLMKTTSYLHISSIQTLITMYGAGAIYLGVMMRIQKEKVTFMEGKVGTCVGLISVVGYSSYFFALHSGIASIIFPIVSLNCLLVVLAGCYLFKEKLRAYQVIGIFVAAFGLVLTKI